MTVYSNTFELTHSKKDAFIMGLKSDSMLRIRDKVRADKITQLQCAKLFGVSQPRVSRLLNGEIGEFSLDMLVGFEFLLDTAEVENAK